MTTTKKLIICIISIAKSQITNNCRRHFRLAVAITAAAAAVVLVTVVVENDDVGGTGVGCDGHGGWAEVYGRVEEIRGRRGYTSLGKKE